VFFFMLSQKGVIVGLKFSNNLVKNYFNL